MAKQTETIRKDDFHNFIKSGYEDIVIPNYYHGDFEMDYMKISKAGILTEFELKVSRNDYKADFLKQSNKGSFGNIITTNKHELIKSGKRCNRFYFVVPEGLININEVPDYCGLIFQKTYGFEVIKNAPLLTNRKYEESFYKKLCVQLAFREQNLRLSRRRSRNAK